jgi:hypothetical protein
LRVFGLLTLGLLAGSCHDATRPSLIPPPSSTLPQPDVLTITPAIEGLKLDATEALTAVIVSGATRRTVPASWSSDAPEVVAVDHEGHVRGVSLGKTNVRATFEALSALQPVRVVLDYEGMWSGDYRITKCTWISGPGPSYCKGLAGAVFPLRAVLTQSGDRLSGTLEFYTNTHDPFEAGPVEGSIDDSGALMLSGTIPSVVSEQPGETRLSDWNTTLTADGDRLAGRFVRYPHFRNFWGWQESREDCEIVNVTRSRP